MSDARYVELNFFMYFVFNRGALCFLFVARKAVLAVSLFDGLVHHFLTGNTVCS